MFLLLVGNVEEVIKVTSIYQNSWCRLQYARTCVYQVSAPFTAPDHPFTLHMPYQMASFACQGLSRLYWRFYHHVGHISGGRHADNERQKIWRRGQLKEKMRYTIQKERVGWLIWVRETKIFPMRRGIKALHISLEFILNAVRLSLRFNLLLSNRVLIDPCIHHVWVSSAHFSFPYKSPNLPQHQHHLAWRPPQRLRLNFRLPPSLLKALKMATVELFSHAGFILCYISSRLF